VRWVLGKASIKSLMMALSREDQVVWETSILIDADERIIAYKGDVDAEEVGELYDDWLNGRVFPIEIQGKTVGYLALPRSSLGERYELALPILAPVGLVSVFLALLTIVIGLLLVRSVVNPLAEVISASGKVAKGDLSARVTVSGPDDMRVLSDSFNQMAGELERNDRERREFLAVIAHELRTPLTVIRGRLEGIVDGIYPPDGTQISPALEETYLLERLVEDLRLLTLTETRQLQFEPRTISLGKLAEHAIGIFSAEATEKGISLSLINNAPNIEAEVDPQRTEQVIGNLISNALRYVPRGGKVKVMVEESDNSVCLHVSDNGPGVPEEDLPHLFQRFWRGEKSRSRASGGTGLGLAIAAQLVEAQGGKISAMNITEGGLKVTISFISAVK
jgi:two-component system sensor histidine kinase BaeS